MPKTKKLKSLRKKIKHAVKSYNRYKSQRERIAKAMPPSYSRYLKNKGIDGLTSLRQDPVATLSSMRNDPHTLATQSLMDISKTPIAEANSLLELSKSRLDNYGSLSSDSSNDEMEGYYNMYTNRKYYK